MNNTLKTLVFACVALLPAIALARPEGAAPKPEKKAEQPTEAAAPSKNREISSCPNNAKELRSLEGMLVSMRKEMEMMRGTLMQLKGQNDMLLKIQQARPMPTDSSRKKEAGKPAAQ